MDRYFYCKKLRYEDISALLQPLLLPLYKRIMVNQPTATAFGSKNCGRWSTKPTIIKRPSVIALTYFLF